MSYTNRPSSDEEVYYYEDQSSPPYSVAWYDGLGEIIDFSAVTDYQLKLIGRLTGETVLTKTTGIEGSDAIPNVVVNWEPDELQVGRGQYWVHLSCTDSDGRVRHFRVGSSPILNILAAV